jgi:hypothetical protein
MTERSIDTAIWSDSWFQELTPPQKLLFIYLWTNPRCSSAGIYEVSVRSISFDIGLPQEVIPELLEGLSPKVCWYPQHSLIWVKNFLRRQTRSPHFLVAVAKSLRHLPPEIVSEFLAYNNTVSIPSLYRMQTVSIPYADPMDTEVDRSDQSKTRPDQKKNKTRESISSPIAPSPAAAAKSISFEDYQGELREEFTDVDFDGELRRFDLYWHEGNRKLKNPKLALLNWMTKARKIKTEEATHERSNGNRQYPQGSTGIPGNRPAGAFADLD